MSDFWSREEVEATVADYFDMLTMQLTGQQYSKTDHNEVALSQSKADLFHIYRLFDFRKEPRLFSFRGPVERHCNLDPVTYQARFS